MDMPSKQIIISENRMSFHFLRVNLLGRKKKRKKKTKRKTVTSFVLFLCSSSNLGAKRFRFLPFCKTSSR